jgi:hypothetical protein
MELSLVIYQTIYLLFTYVTWIIIKSVKSKQPKYLTGNYKNSKFLEAITELELETVLKNMDANKSPGYDNFSNKIIKLSAT